jgi:putative transposase
LKPLKVWLVWSFAYLAVRNLFALVWLLARPRRWKELEMLVLRHELAMLRRQGRQPKLRPADRGLLAALSRSLPRAAWAGFPVKPETPLRRHRRLVAGRWTYADRKAGRPPLERSLRELILRLARESSPAVGIQADRRRAQACRHQRLCDVGAQGDGRSGS